MAFQTSECLLLKQCNGATCQTTEGSLSSDHHGQMFSLKNIVFGGAMSGAILYKRKKRNTAKNNWPTKFNIWPQQISTAEFCPMHVCYCHLLYLSAVASTTISFYRLKGMQTGRKRTCGAVPWVLSSWIRLYFDKKKNAQTVCPNRILQLNQQKWRSHQRRLVKRKKEKIWSRFCKNAKCISWLAVKWPNWLQSAGEQCCLSSLKTFKHHTVWLIAWLGSTANSKLANLIGPLWMWEINSSPSCFPVSWENTVCEWMQWYCPVELDEWKRHYFLFPRV